MVSIAIFAALAAVLLVGWWRRAESPIDPHSGLGYALGIIGGTMMLVLLGYPLRKRMRRGGRRMGSVAFWFRFHMLLGLLGPLAILYHARFSWGALNSAFALGAMIVVSASGLVGRFFYSRVHRGYSDRKLEMRELKSDMDGSIARLVGAEADIAQLVERLQALESRAIAAGSHFWSSAGAVFGIGIATRVSLWTILRAHPGLRTSAPARDSLRAYFQAVRRAAEFAFYDRLLRLWHLLHLPLFIMLVAAAILHVVAVHMY
ncbi:MAG: hypothetical protein KGM17_10690 [Sphingomonadales bacterium]|nr:hypothetical protein [Sphingomonadales bacterium]